MSDTGTGVGVWDAPYQAEIDAAQSSGDLVAIYRKYGEGMPPGPAMNHLAMALDVRKAELDQQPDPVQVVTSMEILAKNENDSYEAQDAYRKALDEWGTAHTEFKTIRAKLYVQLRPNHKSAADTDQYVDADDAVAAARLRAYLAEGMVKAAKSNMDRLERQFQYHRSLMVNERQVDRRPSAGGL